MTPYYKYDSILTNMTNTKAVSWKKLKMWSAMKMQAYKVGK